MVSRDEYNKYINELLKNDPKAAELDKLSNSNSSLAVFFTVVGIFLTMIGLFLTFFKNFFLILIIGVIFLIIGFSKNIQKSGLMNYLSSTYKAQIIDYLLKNHTHAYSQEDYIDEKIFNDSQFHDHSFMKNYYDVYEGEDLLKINIPNDDGSKSENYLSLCDLLIEEIETNKEGEKQTYTIYDGTFGYIDFPFNFKCALTINTSYIRKDLKFQKIELEDIKFNQKFKILGTDQIEARYILTPNMMENLMRLFKSFHRFKLVLVDDKMYLGFEYKNLFEFSTLKSGRPESIFDNFYTDIETILNIVNELKTNNKIFKM